MGLGHRAALTSPVSQALFQHSLLVTRAAGRPCPQGTYGPAGETESKHRRNKYVTECKYVPRAWAQTASVQSPAESVLCSEGPERCCF